MKFAIVAGSHRKNSQSDKVANYLRARLSALVSGAEGTVLSLAGNPLPLWDEEVWAKAPKWQEAWRPYGEALHAAEAMIFVVPEWGGMVPPAFKNFLLLCSAETRHKPVLIVSVSSGIGGSYPVSELRMSGYKNTFISYLPEHLIVRNVTQVLNEGAPNAALEEDRLRERIDDTLKLLGVYGEAYRAIRSTKAVDLNKYPFGM
ncbi:MAG: NADPH-dependent oxidoreductase [Proteobacteria bacterium]|nr:MAG: NADPH-dependent oxidoreductase [Pseudomonadota bacterium]